MNWVMRVCDVLAIAWGAALAWREIRYEIGRFVARIRHNKQVLTCNRIQGGSL